MSEKNNSLFNDSNVAEPVKSDYPELEITRDTVDVPLSSARYSVYEPGHPLFQQEIVTFVELTPLEESILYDKTRIRNGTVIDDIVQVSLQNKMLNVNTLLSGDRDGIFSILRGVCFDEIYKFDMECPKCETVQEISFNILEKLNFKAIDLNSVVQLKPNSNLFKFTFPKSQFEVIYKYLTVGDAKRVSKEKKDRQKAGIDPRMDLVHDLASVIISINGITDRAKILEVMTNISTRDSAALRKHIMNTEPGLDTSFDFECSQRDCKHKEKSDMKLDASFFFPLLK